MDIIIGSQNPAKVQAVKTVFQDAKVIGMNVSSDVSSQPFSEEETLLGAKNRAKHAISSGDASIGIGLEGGVATYNSQLFLINWGALVDQTGEMYVASGARIPLPEEIGVELKKGYELGDVMEQYAHKQDVRKKEGAIGIFTNDLISRADMFTHIMYLLKGQYEFSNK
ncbi:Non-canonical purine NTP phosphatase [Paraliobacillus sp. PM-2]|uniref:DUF84 family protein n=1 Tax=Paraliobacillus sp. PM-2 TaxID=1462524 RepID=UPI00061C7B66|nr:DUF84 family protein [Paraliobacillus sp. PM-2]CQR48172.1 Non-canonical purine NTP phosphatase [Paraliobacillus sp. PM-2]